MQLTDEQIEKIESELSTVDAEELFNEILDSEGTVTVGGIEFDRSRILKELDSIAYDQGLADFFADEDILVEVNGEYYNMHEVENLIEEMENDDE